MHDFEHYETLKQRQQLADKCDTGKDCTIIPVRLTVAVQRKDDYLDT